MQGNYFLVREGSKIEHINKYVFDKIKEILAKNKTPFVKVDEYKNPRSLSANALYWVWMDDLAKLFNNKGMKIQVFNSDIKERDYTKDDCHDLMRTMFLGYEEKQLSNTVIKKLKSTRFEDKTKFYEYMESIQEWSIEKLKHNLPDPLDNELQKYQRKQNK